LPPQSPNLNAYMERWFRSLKFECLDRMVFFGERSLKRAVCEYVEHYYRERNHQGLGINSSNQMTSSVAVRAGSSAVNDLVVCLSTTTVTLPDDSCHESDVNFLR